MKKRDRQETHIYEKYAEFIQLMRVPAIEQAIRTALTKILALLKLEKEHK